MSAVRGVAAGAAAACALTAAGLPGGPWWAAVLAGALFWPAIVRAPPMRAALLAALALVPVGALGYHGLVRLDPVAYAAVIAAVAAAYGLLGGAAAALADAFARRACGGGRAHPERGACTGCALPLAWRPLPWASAWFALDALAAHGAFGAASLPVTPGYLLAGAPLLPWAAVGGPAALGFAWLVTGVAAASLLPGRVGLPGGTLWRLAAVVAFVGPVLWPKPPAVPNDAPTAAAGVTTRRLAVLHTGIIPTAPGPDLSPHPQLAAFEGAAAAFERVDLHVWPEMALGRALARDVAPLARAADRLGAPVLAGAVREIEEGERNAAAFADRSGGGFPAEKRRLVPRFEAWASPGMGERWPLRVAGWRWGVLICWESLMHAEAIARVRAGADALVVLADGAWAEGTITPWWHARAARVLAVASGRPVVFAATLGPSRAWRHDGRATGFAPAGASGAVMSVVGAPWGLTPFVRFGLPGLLLVWATATALALTAIHGRARHGGRTEPTWSCA